MFKELLNTIGNKYDTIKKENDNLNNLMNQTTTFKNLFKIENLNIEPSEHRIAFITADSPDINTDKAILISKLIPINETIIYSYYSKELLTNIEYYLIFTDKYLWVINQNNYGAFQYQQLTSQIIKNNLMSKIILLNNILLEINGNDTKINNLINIINNNQIREQMIKEKTNYLCNTTPIYQQINSIYSGISIDNNNNIVFHTKNRNYKYNICDIDNYEILLDNQIYSSKKYNQSKSIGSFQTSCYQITLRITTKQNEMITVPILEQNSLNTKYTSHDSTFKKNLEFANKLTNKLNEITPKY